ncbi:MAG: methionine--tRNA ligase subunit beta [Patescibacteria group bacterium]|jgi:methionine--tRNA ligase beta chain|nr:methionine--tRNA ligase subunit beta [Patescibacteria group bacterium]
MELINLEYFKKLDIRVAQILEAEKVVGTDKLLKLKIDIGNEQRIIVSGIGSQYQPEELIGKQIIVLANLEPKTFKGIESQGMLLAAVNENGGIALLVPDKKMGVGDKIS